MFIMKLYRSPTISLGRGTEVSYHTDLGDPSKLPKTEVAPQFGVDGFALISELKKHGKHKARHYSISIFSLV